MSLSKSATDRVEDYMYRNIQDVYKCLKQVPVVINEIADDIKQSLDGMSQVPQKVIAKFVIQVRNNMRQDNDLPFCTQLVITAADMTIEGLRAIVMSAISVYITSHCREVQLVKDVVSIANRINAKITLINEQTNRLLDEFPIIKRIQKLSVEVLRFLGFQRFKDLINAGFDMMKEGTRNFLKSKPELNEAIVKQVLVQMIEWVVNQSLATLVTLLVNVMKEILEHVLPELIRKGMSKITESFMKQLNRCVKEVGKDPAKARSIHEALIINTPRQAAKRLAKSGAINVVVEGAFTIYDIRKKYKEGGTSTEFRQYVVERSCQGVGSTVLSTVGQVTFTACAAAVTLNPIGIVVGAVSVGVVTSIAGGVMGKKVGKAIVG